MEEELTFTHSGLRRDSSNQRQYILFVLMTYLFVFQDYLERLLPVFSYFDECFALISVIIFLFNLSGRFHRAKNSLLFPATLFTLVGIISTIMYQYQPLLSCLADLYLSIKFWLALYVGYYLFNKFDFMGYARRLSIHCMIITIVFCVLLFSAFFIEYVLGIKSSMFGGIRYGLPSIKLIYSLPAMFNSACTFILTICVIIVPKSYYAKCCVLVIPWLMLGTLRSVSFGAVAILMSIYILLIRGKKKLKLTSIILTVIFAVLIGWNQINEYYNNPSAPRQILTSTSFDIMIDYFPFGTGLATFGSYYSVNPYSPVYYKYNLNSVWGLSTEEHYFNCDTFWPVIMAQTGFLGLISYLLLLCNVFKRIQLLYYNNKRYYYASIFVFCYMLMTSLAGTAFFHPMLMPFAMILGTLLSHEKAGSNNMIKHNF